MVTRKDTGMIVPPTLALCGCAVPAASLIGDASQRRCWVRFFLITVSELWQGGPWMVGVAPSQGSSKIQS
jgi:hypothetical protein